MIAVSWRLSSQLGRITLAHCTYLGRRGMIAEYDGQAGLRYGPNGPYYGLPEPFGGFRIAFGTSYNRFDSHSHLA